MTLKKLPALLESFEMKAKGFLKLYLLIPSLVSCSSCIEFESQEILYYHDEEKDELRMTLRYEGIFGNLQKGQNTQKNPDDIATSDKLNQKQVEQLASVLNGGRAFFFSNWIFEYDRRALPEMLKQVKNEPAHEGKVFGQPEEDLIKALLEHVEIGNVGFYKDAKERLCGAQTLRLSNASEVISLANRVLGRQLRAHISELKEERDKKVPNSFAQETVDLIESKLQTDFPFIQVEGNLITLTLIMTHPDQKRISESTLKDLPQGTRIEFQDEVMLIKIGNKEDGSDRLWKKCFEGYLPNALNHIEKNHKNLLLKPKKMKQRLRNFLTPRSGG